MRHPYFDLPRPIVIGHRGSAGTHPENTLPSFERALQDGAAILESDVHSTLDGVIVLFHDRELDRTTDGRGPIAQRTLAELKQLDAGYRCSPDAGRSFPFRGRGVRIPTLEEAFEAFPDARFNLELKQTTNHAAARLVELVERKRRAERTLLAAGSDDVMKTLREAVARQRLGVAMGASGRDVLGFIRAALAAEPPPPEPMALQIPPAFGGRPLVTRELVEHAHRYEVQVHVWTINDPAEMNRLLDLGVDGIISDFPKRLAACIATRG